MPSSQRAHGLAMSMHREFWRTRVPHSPGSGLSVFVLLSASRLWAAVICTEDGLRTVNYMIMSFCLEAEISTGNGSEGGRLRFSLYGFPVS